MVNLGRKLQKAVAFTLIIATILSTAVIFYSLTSYLGIFKAIRAIDLSVSGFTFEILDATHAVVKTELTVNNTSNYEFNVLGIEQRVEVNGMYVGSVRSADVSQSSPLRVPSQSSRKPTLRLDLDFGFLPSEVLELLLDPSSRKSWFIFMDVSFDGPLIGKFSMATQRSINAS